MSSLFMPNRRTFLQGGLAAAAASSLPLPAFAAGGNCVVSTWGGDFQKLLDAAIAQPMATAGSGVVQWDVGMHDARKSRMLSERRLPAGTLDVVALQDTDMFDMHLAKTLEEIDESKVPNYANVLPAFRTGHSAAQIYSALVLIYNPAHMQPTSWAELWDPKYAGKIGLPGALPTVVMSMATMAGGETSLSNFDKGKQMLMDLKKLNPRVYPSNEAVGQALQSGEIWAVPLWRARGVQWQKAGLPVTSVAPLEGIMPITYELGVPKNAPNKEAAFAFLNQALSTEAQLGFAEGMGYSPVVNNAPLPAELAARIGFTEEEVARIRLTDLDYVSRENDKMKQWWDREFLG